MRQTGGSLVVPEWLADGSRFWYADTRFSGRTAVQNTIYLVDPAATNASRRT